jgi:hypothetical protein
MKCTARPELLHELLQEPVCRLALQRVVAAQFQIASQLGELLRGKTVRGIEHSRVELGCTICVHDAYFWHLGVELELNALQQHRVVDSL